MRFIVFEGIDGSGKSTLIKGLIQELQKRHIEYVVTREPGGTPLGDQIRQLILKTEGRAPTPRTELLLYEASRAQHVDEVINPNLKNGKWVLCDRFTASSVAFQSGGRNISLEQVDWLNDFATASKKPDLTVLLDLSVEISAQRQENRIQQTGNKKDRMEAEARDFHERVRQNYLKQSRQPNWFVLSATDTPQVLLEKLIVKLRELKWLDS